MEVSDSDKDLKRSRFYPLPRDLTFEIEKPLFQKWAAGKKALVEIGVFEGASASHFRGAMSKDGLLTLIDPFVPDSVNSKLKGRWVFARFNVERIRNGKVRWIRDFSYNFVKSWTKPIDFLFIDGDHQEASCRQDWEQWSKFVEVGGVVIFHDARKGLGDGTNWDGWEGPTFVVNSLFRGNSNLADWEIVDEAGTSVVVRRVR